MHTKRIIEKRGCKKARTAKKRIKALKTQGFQCFERDIDHNQNKVRRGVITQFPIQKQQKTKDISLNALGFLLELHIVFRIY